MIKKGGPLLHSRLSRLFSHLYKNKYVPIKWREGRTILVPKKGTEIGLDNHRPITLLAVEYKLYTHILNVALNKSIKKFNLIPSSQNSFQEKRGTDNCIEAIINIIKDSNKRKKELHIAYIDFAKAFDSVEHWALDEIVSYMNLGYLGEIAVHTIKNSKTKIELAHKFTDAVNLKRGTK